MERKYFSGLLALAMLFFFSCSNDKSIIKVADRNFADEIDLQQNLVFIFNNDLAPDSLLQIWSTEDYIKFTPAVRGKFKWSAPRELVFSPDIRFSPSTDYKAELSENILKVSAEPLSLDKERAFSFHTPYLTLVNATTFWGKKEGNKNLAELKLDLNFNCKVNPSDVKNLLKISTGGRDLSFELKSAMISETVKIAIEDNGQKLDEEALKITVDKGLKCAESEYVSEKEMSIETLAPSKGVFQIARIEAMYEDDNGSIYVETNQEPATQDIASLLKLSPKVNYKIENSPSGFYIRGDFRNGEAYTLKIKKELKGIFGTTLKEDYEHTVVFGNQEPYISFVSKSGLYLTSKGEKNVGIKIINVPRVKVTVIKIYANNILHFLRNNGGFRNYYYDEDDYYYDYDYYGYSSFHDMGDVAFEREFSTASLKKSGSMNLLNLNLSDINDYNGIYLVKVSSTEKQWIRSSKVVSVSDIGLIVKETEDDILVFANSILTANAIPGAEVNLVSTNNQSVYQAVTDKDGVARFRDIKKKAPGFRIEMLTTRSGDDFNYLHFRQTKVETSRFEVGGLRKNPSGYQAFIYGDRDIYRPGETMNFNTIVRNEKWQPLTQAPVKLKVLLPNGKEFVTKRGTLNSQGAFETSVQLPASVVTGTYNAELYSANDVLLNSKNISVEEFIPDRIKVNLSVAKDQYKAGESIDVSAEALNLFGPPASNRNYEMEFVLRRKNFFAKGFGAYNFHIRGTSGINFENNMLQGATDEEGMAKGKFTVSEEYNDMGLLEGKIFVTVFDESGRPVNRIKSVDVLTQDVFFGVKSTEYYVSNRQPVQIGLIALNKDGKIQNSQVRVQVIRYNWQTVLEKTYSGYRYVSQKKEQIIDDKVVPVKGENTFFAVRAVQSGEYEVRVSKPGTDAYVAQNFYAYSWGSSGNSSFEVNKEGNIAIETDKSSYKVGEKANIIFKTPFSGRMLVTIEQDNVYDYFYINTDGKTAALSIPVKDEYLPNAYISATLIKPIEESAIPLTVAHGYAVLVAEKEMHRLPLEIQAVDHSRSSMKQDICIKSKPESDIEVTLAVVDEGILQLKNMKSPDPYAFFFQRKALEVRSYDLYPILLPELKMSSSSTAGDGYDLDKRVNPLTNKRVKLVSFWSGILKTNSSGEACYSVDLPKFSGDLRIMAVAYKGNAFGFASTNMKVSDPVVISTSLPRFMSPGDTVIVPVMVTNTTASPANAKVQLELTGPVSFAGEKSKEINVRANSEVQVQFKVVASMSFGEAKVKTTVSALNEKFSEEVDITVRPVTSLLKQSGAGRADANKTERLNLTHEFIPSTTSAKLVLSKSPLVEFTDQLDYLLGYPHGCVEQTISKAFPQIYFAEIAKTLNFRSSKGENPAYNVQEAIRKLQSMQLYSGGMSYWQGGYNESWWGSVYAAHFLSEAKKAGYEVSNTMLDKIYSYLQYKVKEKSTFDYYYYDGAGAYRVARMAPKDIFYSLYVLANAGKQDLATMNYYKANTSLLAMDSKYLLAATYLTLGDHASYRALVPSSFEGERSINASGGSFYSYIRDMAISLNVLVETDPDNIQIPVLAKHLSAQLRGQRFYSTQESAFALLALGKLAVKANQSDITAEIKADGKKIGEFKGNSTLVLSKDLAGKNVEVVTRGSGSLYYFWQMEGLSASGKVTEEDKYIRVRKTFYDRTGKQISNNVYKQNDLVVVKLTVSTTDNSRVENVVITDMLPAGFEIENPRLSQSPDMPWITRQDEPEHFDFRDDRINLFTTVTGSTKTFYYMVRAVSKGTFRMGPVSADAMYNGEYHSYFGSGQVTVTDKRGPNP